MRISEYLLQDYLNSFQKFVQVSSDLNININWAKTNIAQRSIKFCGFAIDCNGYSFKPSYIMELKTLNSPCREYD